MKTEKETVISLTLQLIKYHLLLNLEEKTSPVALVGPHTAVWPTYLGTELSVIGKKTNCDYTTYVGLVLYCNIILTFLYYPIISSPLDAAWSPH